MKTIDGLWLFTNPGDHCGPPELIKVEHNLILNYQFIPNVSSPELTPQYTGRTAETFSQVQAEFISTNRMRLHIPGKRYNSTGNDSEGTTEDIILIKQYERLRPTNTKLTIEEISKLKFSLSWIKDGAFVAFGENLDTDIIQILNKRLKKKGLRIYLQIFEGTYFLAFWNDDYIDAIFPIIEIDKFRVVVSGFTTFPHERIGYIFN